MRRHRCGTAPIPFNPGSTKVLHSGEKLEQARRTYLVLAAERRHQLHVYPTPVVVYQGTVGILL
jgi:hypothetical protein